jgi:hypothetical protein
MRLNIQLPTFGRGHAFGRVGSGRKTEFADRRRVNRGTGKIRLSKEQRASFGS